LFRQEQKIAYLRHALDLSLPRLKGRLPSRPRLSPAIRFFRERLRGNPDAPFLYRRGSGLLLRQWDLLARGGLMKYLLIKAEAPT